MYYKLPIEARRDLINHYKTAYPDMRYSDMVKHFNTFAEGGEVDPPENADGKLSILDNRKIDPITKKPLVSTQRKAMTVDSAYVDNLIQQAYKYKHNPNTVLAMALQETKMGTAKGYKDNPMHLDGEKDNFLVKSMKLFEEKKKLAQRLGKKTDADIIQAWNGYGKIFNTPDNPDMMYGLDMSKQPVVGKTGTRGIDFNKNPIYGKTVVNLRDSVIKQSPEIQELVKKYKPKT